MMFFILALRPVVELVPKNGVHSDLISTKPMPCLKKKVDLGTLISHKKKDHGSDPGICLEKVIVVPVSEYTKSPLNKPGRIVY